MLQRIQNIREMGRSIFMNTQSGQQLYFSLNDTPDFETARTLRRGDIISITQSEDFVTRTGEPTIRVQGFAVTARCTRDIPLVVATEERTFNELSTELQRHDRVLNWIVNPSSLNYIRQRSAITRTIRSLLENDDAMEVETPILQANYGGAAARPFVTHHNALDRDFYLRISPELYLKRMIIAGLPFVYEFSRCFRNEGVDRNHNPEFTLLEFYMVDRDWQHGMSYTEAIVSQVLGTSAPFQRVDFLGSLQAIGIETANMSADELDDAFSEHIEPGLIEPTFVCNHPAHMSPLAYSADGQVAERFELYVQGMEIANGYSEQNDAVAQRAAMEAMGNVDEDYLAALSLGMTRTCGVGIGIDRLVMLALNQHNIRDIIAFPV